MNVQPTSTLPSSTPTRSAAWSRYLIPVTGTHRLRRIAQVCAGGLVMGLGVSVCLDARLGLDTYSLFIDGVGRHLGLSFPVATVVVGAALTALWLLGLRQPAGLATVAQPVLCSAAVAVAAKIPITTDSLLIRWVLLAAGIAVVCAGIACYLGAGLGPAPVDGVPLALTRRRLPLKVSITGMQVTMLVAGVALGGQWGVGTFVAAAVFGPLIDRLVPLFTVLQPPAVPAAQGGRTVAGSRA